MLSGNTYPKLRHIVDVLDDYLARKHPDFFGANAIRPFSPLKPFKVIHDPLWGTNSFSWRELVLIDSPILQRLRSIHQTGLAYYVYPSARHSRFEHSLGVLTIASRIYEALFERYKGTLLTIATAIGGKDKELETVARLKQELRLAALLHDSGHSMFSHASERVYSEMEILKQAAKELSDFLGREKGAGEVLSFCLAHTSAVAGLLERAKEKVLKEEDVDGLSWEIDLANVALMIVGSAAHPDLQFLGDIVSSGLDADKLDYLLRDASSAGLPLRYDFERYMYTVSLEKDYTVDPDGALAKLFAALGTKVLARTPAGKIRYPYFDTYRLRLPKRATSAVEQIVICKIMLFSYIYHHQKVRAAEGLFEKLLAVLLQRWRGEKKSEEDILINFIGLDDTALTGVNFLMSSYADIGSTSYRLVNRILPRVVYQLSSAVSHAEGQLVQEFFLMLKERAKRKKLIEELEARVGEELVKLDQSLGKDPADALWKAGVWVDAPKPPQIEEVELSAGEYPAITIENLFPVEEWTEAYQAHIYYVRIYSYSEYVALTAKAGRRALQQMVGIKTDDFYESARRKRD